MRAWPPAPAPDDHWRNYATSTESERRAIRLASARYRYGYERETCYFDHYFPRFDTAAFVGKRLLDLGCFTGGRLLYWIQRYGLVGTGLDVEERLAQGGQEFAEEMGIGATFDVGFAEAMPYADGSFDYIASYDVLEHVRSVQEALSECHRVLRQGGKLFAVFPQFYQPLESHLGQATQMPALHWLFSGPVLTRAHYEICKEVGNPCCKPKLESWERLPTLNGITVRRFRELIRRDWAVSYWGTNPILSDGRRARDPLFRTLRSLFVLPARLPLFEELFLGRICCVLEKA